MGKREYRWNRQKALRAAWSIGAFLCLLLVVGFSAFSLGGKAAQRTPTPAQTQTSGGPVTSSIPPTVDPSSLAIAQLTKRTLTNANIQSAGLLVLVNKVNLWPHNSTPSQLADIKQYKTTSAYGLKDNAMRADKRACMALDAMMVEAGKQGHRDIVVMSSYRGYEKQRILFDQQVQEFTDRGYSLSEAQTRANTTVSRPGESEHHTGMAFDLAVENIAMEQFGDTPQGLWVKQNCTKFGFILRYEPQKAPITGIASEPWHFRYVGVEVAQAMAAKGQCLEEYVANK